jgi:DHA1 family multidrug resistance protein-like MFS transporter
VASGTPRERLGETLGKLQLAIFLGQALGPTTGGFVADTLGYRATFWLTAVYLVISGTLIMTLVREQFTPSEEALEGTVWQHMRADVSGILAGSLLGLVLGLRFALQVGLRMSSPTVPLIVQELLPSNTLLGSASGLLTTVSGISSALAAPTVGRWADRGSGRLLLMVSAFLSAAAMIIQGVAPTYGWMIIGQFLVGLGVGGTLAVISAYIGRLAPEGKVGTAFGLDAMAVSLSGAVGPMVGGWLSDAVSRRAPLYVGGIVMAVAAVTVLWLPKEIQAQPAAEAVPE